MKLRTPLSTAAPPRPRIRDRRTLLWALAAAALIIGVACSAWLSPQLAPTQPAEQRPLLQLTAYYGLAWCGYALACLLSTRSGQGGGAMPVTIVALTVRLIMAPSALIESDDAYRYVLDGHTLLAGQNPYAHTPQELAADPRPAWLAGAPAAAETILRHINNPGVHTIYPPLAQTVFAVAAWLRPWSLLGPRLVFLATDLLTILVLISYLRRLHHPPAQIVWYAWNPLVILEIANGAHADSLAALLVVLLAGRLLGIESQSRRGTRISSGAGLALRQDSFDAGPGPMSCSGPALSMHSRSARTRRFIVVEALAAGALLGLGTLSKLYPLVLLPAVLVSGSRRGARSFVPAVLLAAAVIIVAGYAPFLSVGAAQVFAGLDTYARNWSNNPGAFQLLAALLGQPRLASAMLIAAAAVGCAARTRLAGGGADATLAGLQHTLLFWLLLQPACFPWYAVPLLALSALRPAAWTVAITAAFGLFYAALHWTYAGDANTVRMVRLLEHAFMWALFLPDLVFGLATSRRPR